MNLDSEQYEQLVLAAAGIAYREAASFIISGNALVARIEPTFDINRMIEWAVILTDYAHELDPAHQRMPKPEEYQHGPATEPI
jgi:hypothetical protein